MYIRFDPGNLSKPTSENQTMYDLHQAMANARMDLYKVFERTGDASVSLTGGGDPVFRPDWEEYILSGKATEDFDKRARALADARTKFFKAFAAQSDG